jgi:hypothetical protein
MIPGTRAAAVAALTLFPFHASLILFSANVFLSFFGFEATSAEAVLKLAINSVPTRYRLRFL